MSKKHNPGSKKPGAQRRRKGPASPSGDNAGGTAEAAPVIEGKGEELNKKKKSGANPFTFLQQVRAEGEKVTWTTRNETFVSTIMVLIMVVIMGVFFFIVDHILRFGVSSLLSVSGA